jgi:signal transduction histidine kinase
MSESRPSLVRSLLVRPLLLSLLPLVALLVLLAGPIRDRLERAEAADCSRNAMQLGEILRGMERPPTDLPRSPGGGKAERILLLDGGQRPVFDSASGRAQHPATWFGPTAYDSLRPAMAGIVRSPEGDRQIRAEVRWGELPAGGSLVLLRSLGPIDARMRGATWIAVALWALAVAAFSLGMLRSLRLLEAERDALRARIDAIPESAPPSSPANRNALDLDRSLREAAARAAGRIAVLWDKIREREAVLHGMLEGVIAVDRERRVLMINPSAERILHLVSAEGRPIAELVRSASFHDLVEEILRDERPGEVEFELEDDRRLRVLGDVFRGRGGELQGVVLVMSDVTEIRRLERIRRDFVANVSHELKTPITVIQGYMETLLEEPDADPEMRAAFTRTVAANAGRMHRIIEDLLALSRVESAGGEIERSEFDVGELVRRTAREFSREASARGIRIDASVPKEIAPLRANAPLLERALGNLIDNAIKYGRRDATLRVVAREDAGAVVFEVCDEGPGIDPVHLPRLFERFYRIDKGRSRELGGTGLGLAIVKHIALAHGGEAGVESRFGEGSTFHLRIPRPAPDRMA